MLAAGPPAPPAPLWKCKESDLRFPGFKATQNMACLSGAVCYGEDIPSCTTKATCYATDKITRCAPHARCCAGGDIELCETGATCHAKHVKKCQPGATCMKI